MAGADGLRLCWDLSRRAGSFLRMARLALTGAAPAQLVVEEEVVDGHSCDPYYKSISTEDNDDLESDELWPEEDELELLVDGGEDGGSTTRGVSENKKPDRFVRRRRASFRSKNVAAVEESSEPLVPRRAAKRANDAEVVQHPFGWDRRGSESSSLLLVSS
ncbi:hypothetical protein SEVIR_3G338810v4 [Setaria viridis]|uniref:Uncharacterized protein n=1 Tax=Setaria viridis TaxID=4556 RepID=A0A4U6VGD3_SETVI|nr:uncharacterized protein LOC117850253 [Setaria viridis]TKW28630.1 hypothetical protein SEVIR_3G338810v2 [Setaria viridis]